MSFYSSKFIIRLTEVDIHDNMYPSSIVRMLMETGNRQMAEQGRTYYELLQDNMSFILVRLAFELSEQIKSGDRVEVRTWISPPKAATIPRSYSVLRDGKTILKAQSDWTVVNLAKGKIAKASEVDMSNYSVDQAFTLKDTKLRFRFAKDRSWKKLEPHRVRYHEIDRNMHMNNTYYENMFWNRVPDVENKKLRSFSLKFFRDAPMDSEIEIFGSQYKAGMKEKALNSLDPNVETRLFRSMVNGEKNCEAVIRMDDVDHE